MKNKIFILFLFLFVPGLLFSQRSGESHKNTTLEFDYSFRDGDITEIIAGVDTMSILGANDTIVTRYYENYGGNMALQFINSGGTTHNYKIIIETSERGFFPAVDSLFKPAYFIHYEGAGIDSAYVSTVDDSIETVGVSSSIFIPALSIDVFRFKIISKSSHDGNTLFERFNLTRWIR